MSTWSRRIQNPKRKGNWKGLQLSSLLNVILENKKDRCSQGWNERLGLLSCISVSLKLTFVCYLGSIMLRSTTLVCVRKIVDCTWYETYLY
jgi:hypothetical protein